MNQYQTPQNTNYGQPQQPQYYPAAPVEKPPTVGNYIVVQLLAMIPLVGFILMIVWAVGGSGTPIWKSNYARAYFVLIAIVVGIVIIITIAFSALIATILSGLGGMAYYW